MIRSPSSLLDITTTVSGPLLSMGLSPIGIAASLAAPEPYERHYRIRLPPWMIGEKCCYSHSAQSMGHAFPRSVSGLCQIERCSPWPAPFSPQAPPKIALLCSSGSSIVWRGPTPPERACPPCGFGPSQTGLVPLRGRGAPEVSRFSCMLFLSVRGFFDYAGPTDRSRLSRYSRGAFLLSGESRRPEFAFFEAQ